MRITSCSQSLLTYFLFDILQCYLIKECLIFFTAFLPSVAYNKYSLIKLSLITLSFVEFAMNSELSYEAWSNFSFVSNLSPILPSLIFLRFSFLQSKNSR